MALVQKYSVMYNEKLMLGPRQESAPGQVDVLAILTSLNIAGAVVKLYTCQECNIIVLTCEPEIAR